MLRTNYLLRKGENIILGRFKVIRLLKMAFTLLTQLEEILLNFIVTSPSSYNELETLVNDLYLGYRNISSGRLSTTLHKLTKKQLITKNKSLHIDSNGRRCKYIYSPTQLAKDLMNDYNSLHDTLKYSITKYAQIKA